MLKFLTVLGGLFALGLMLISVGANFVFGTLLTTGPERWLYGGVFALLDGLKTVLLPLSAAAFAAGSKSKGVVAVLVFAVLTVLSFTAEIGLYATTKSEVVGDAKAAHQRYVDARAAKAKADAAVTAIGPVRSAADITGDIATLKRDRLYDRSKQCTEATAPESRELCAKLDRLAAEQAKASEALQLRQAAEQARAALDKLDVAAAMRSIDPQAEALARLVKPVVDADPDTVRTALAVLIALLVELGSGVGPWLASPSHRRIAEKAEEASPAPEAPAVAEPVPTPAGEPAVEPVPAIDDLVARFAAERLVRRRGAFLPAADVRAQYELYCAGTGVDAANATAFGRAMTALGYTRSKVGGVIRYDNLALAAVAAPPALRVVAGGKRVLGPMAKTAG
jgi:hypothetical protein